MMRWRKEPKETGLRAVLARPRSSFLRDQSGKRFACVSQLLDGGWYWVAGWDSPVPYQNTCHEPVATEKEAKAQAMAYVRAHLKVVQQNKDVA